MLPLLSALETQEASDWWLVDSGGTVSVLAIQNLKNYKIVSREPFKSTGFYAANGTIVKMLEKVKIEVQVTGWKDDWTESVTVVMGAFSGGYQKQHFEHFLFEPKWMEHLFGM